MYRNGKQHDPITVPSLIFGRAAPLGNSWRMSNDIFNAWRAIWRITNQAVAHSKYNRPGAFADMDMLMWVFQLAILSALLIRSVSVSVLFRTKKSASTSASGP